MHPTDVALNRADCGTFALLVGTGRERFQGIDAILAAVPGLPGWTVLRGTGGWVGPSGLETEPSAVVLLQGIHSGTAGMVAETLRASLGESCVTILPLALAGPAWNVQSLAPAMPNGWPPEAEANGG